MVRNQGKLAGSANSYNELRTVMVCHTMPQAVTRAPTLFCRSCHGNIAGKCWEALVVLVDSITQCVAQKPQRAEEKQAGNLWTNWQKPAIFQSLMESGVSYHILSYLIFVRSTGVPHFHGEKSPSWPLHQREDGIRTLQRLSMDPIWSLLNCNRTTKLPTATNRLWYAICFDYLFHQWLVQIDHPRVINSLLLCCNSLLCSKFWWGNKAV